MLKKAVRNLAMYVASVILITYFVYAQSQTPRNPDIQLLADAFGISYDLADRYHDASVMMHEAHLEDVDEELINLYDLLYKIIQLNLRIHTAEKNLRVTRGKIRNLWLRNPTLVAPALAAHREEIEEVLQEIRYVARFWRIMFEPHLSKPAEEFCLNRNEIDLCNQLFEHVMVLFKVTLFGNGRLIRAYERIASAQNG